jgi:hypothetical protein
MVSLPSEPFCTVREFPALLGDQHLLPSAKIGTQRGCKNRSGRRQPAQCPSTRMRFSSSYGSSIYGAPVRYRDSNSYCNAIKHRSNGCASRFRGPDSDPRALSSCQCLPSVAWPRPSRSSLPLKWAASTRFAGSAFSPRFGIGPL